MISPFCLGRGTADSVIDSTEQDALLASLLQQCKRPLNRVLLLPPDHTRLNSGAGAITCALYRLLSLTATVDIMPALGTHVPMGPAELTLLFGTEIPLDRFLPHDWRNDIRHVGDISGEEIRDWSGGLVEYGVRVDVNKILFTGYDLIISIGQIVPHEVVGMANYTKNLMVGVGGPDIINKSHFLGASYGMERIMGRADTPVRRLFNVAAERFLSELPIVYVQTVMQKVAGTMVMRGLFVGAGEEPYRRGAALSQRVNLDLLDQPLRKVVVYLDPSEFKSTWLGNKAIYRTRMAMADGGELIILAPALREFGEDPQIDKLIRKYGYRGTAATLESVRAHEDLRDNLGAAAHLIHGSSEGRFSITYCPGSEMSRAEVESVGFQSGDLAAMLHRYTPAALQDGMNVLPDGEELFFISNPALGLWALKRDFTF